MRRIFSYIMLVLVTGVLFFGSENASGMPMMIGNEQQRVTKEDVLKFKKKVLEKRKLNEMLKLEPEHKEGIENILLVGVDSKDSNVGRSDAIMILTLDKNKGVMKLTSIMRDTYVKISGHGKEKLNHSYAYGGIKLLKETVENTFKVKIDNYAIVNFRGFENVVDVIGGVEVDIDKDELPIVNCVLKEKLDDTGKTILNGKGALQYARIRKVGNGSYGRTSREREVLESLTQRGKKISILKYPALIKAVLKSVKTDIGFTKTLDYGYWVAKNTGNGLEKIQIPDTNKSEGVLLPKKGWVLKMDEIYNIKLIREFIYGNEKM